MLSRVGDVLLSAQMYVDSYQGTELQTKEILEAFVKHGTIRKVKATVIGNLSDEYIQHILDDNTDNLKRLMQKKQQEQEEEEEEEEEESRQPKMRREVPKRKKTAPAARRVAGNDNDDDDDDDEVLAGKRKRGRKVKRRKVE